MALLQPAMAVQPQHQPGPPPQRPSGQPASRWCSSSNISSRLVHRRPSRRASSAVEAATTPAAAAGGVLAPGWASAASRASASDANQPRREGSYEAPLVAQQAGKQDSEQPTLGSALPALDPATTTTSDASSSSSAATLDVAVVGAGPAGLALAAELAATGLSVALVSPESKFVNNYGVWLDEFQALGLEHTLDAGVRCGAAVGCDERSWGGEAMAGRQHQCGGGGRGMRPGAALPCPAALSNL